MGRQVVEKLPPPPPMLPTSTTHTQHMPRNRFLNTLPQQLRPSPTTNTLSLSHPSPTPTSSPARSPLTPTPHPHLALPSLTTLPPSPLTQCPPHTLSCPRSRFHPSPPHTLSSPHTPSPSNTHLQGVCLQKVDPAGGRASSQQIRSRGIAKGTWLLRRPHLLSWTPKPRPAKPRGAGGPWRA